MFLRAFSRRVALALILLTALISNRSVAATVPATQPDIGDAQSTEFDRVTTCSTRVYYNGFDGVAPGPEWSIGRVGRTKKGNRPYLGGFRPGNPVTLTLGGLPTHVLVRITFDLFLERSWDGSSPRFGSTRWDMGLGDGRSLIHTSFCNSGFFSDNDEQAFPDCYPARTHRAWTGAAEGQTLGAMQSWGGPDRTFDASSVYHFVLTFPHAGDEILFRFFSTSTQRDQNKPFGLANVAVETLDNLPKHSDIELAKMWADLGSANPMVFFCAEWDLIAAGKPAAEFVDKHIGENIDLPEKDIRDLIDRLRTGRDGDVNAHRTAALTIQGELAATPIGDALAGPDLSADFRTYLQTAQQFVERFPETATQLRLQRARQVLEAIGAPTAIWERAARTEIDRPGNDQPLARRLSELFPSLSSDSLTPAEP